jgi:uncharacterized protein (DUF1697 family)
MGRYVALLRGINVGGRNLIKMSALKASFEGHGLTGVVTFIQSGNVLFDAPGAGASPTKLVREIEALLSRTFGYQASVVLRSHKQLQAVVERAPGGFGRQPAKYRYDVLFLKEPLRPATAMGSVLTRAGVDEAHAGPGVLYYSRLISKVTQSQLSRIAGSPIYARLTIRNWNTTTKLLQLLDAPAAG